MANIVRVVAYTWFTLVIALTGFLPDFRPVLQMRGFLVRWCFRSCGRNFQVASRVQINFTKRVTIGRDVYLASGCWLQGVGNITLGDEVMLGPYTILASNNHTKKNNSYRFGPGATAPIELKRGVWTGAHVVITAGVTVGEGGAVAAGSVVTKDVEDHATVGGVPAKVIARETEHRQ